MKTKTVIHWRDIKLRRSGCYNLKIFSNGEKKKLDLVSRARGLGKHSRKHLTVSVVWTVPLEKSPLALTSIYLYNMGHILHLNVNVQNREEGLRGKGKGWSQLLRYSYYLQGIWWAAELATCPSRTPPSLRHPRDPDWGISGDRKWTDGCIMDGRQQQKVLRIINPVHSRLKLNVPG